MLRKYLEAGKIAFEVKEFAREIITPGVDLLRIAELIEAKIVELGGKPAFPVNLSKNDIAAHYTPSRDSKETLLEEDVLKVDIGVHVDGYIADTAFTVGGGNLTKASEKALSEAISIVKAGTSVLEIGRVIEQVIRERGFKPIENLGGHSIDRWNLHSGVTVPNVPKGRDFKLKEGMVIAIEPFSSMGSGRVVDTEEVYIFQFIREVPIRLKGARELLNRVKLEFGSLPFAERWISGYSKRTLEILMTELVKAGALYPHRVLREAKRGLVAQAEETLIVERDGCEVITSL